MTLHEWYHLELEPETPQVHIQKNLLEHIQKFEKESINEATFHNFFMVLVNTFHNLGDFELLYWDDNWTDADKFRLPLINGCFLHRGIQIYRMWKWLFDNQNNENASITAFERKPDDGDIGDNEFAPLTRSRSSNNYTTVYDRNVLWERYNDLLSDLYNEIASRLKTVVWF
jgi:hypothetical protein